MTETGEARSEADRAADRCPGHGWVGIAANASSGRGAGRRAVERLVGALDRLGYAARVAWSPDDRKGLVAEAGADPNCRCLVAAGGDGTVAALVNERPGVPITALPAGTENLFARHFGMTRRPEEVARTIAGGRTARIDLGRVGPRRFALMAGIGFDADVVTRHHLSRIGLTGAMRPTRRSAYVEPVLRSTFAYRFPPLTVAVADPGAEEILNGSTAFVFNLPRYALGLPFAPSALGDDGWLDLIVFRDPGALPSLRYLWLVLRGIHLHRPGIHHRRVRRVTIVPDSPVPVQLDGDPGGLVHAAGGPTPWAIDILPRAVDVMVPDAYARTVG